MDLKILIVDDDLGHVDLIMRNLKRAGIVNLIQHFHDGQEILDFFYADSKEKDQFDSFLILLDIRMPKVDGIDVLKKLKQDPHYKEIPIIMLTTTDDPGEIKRCHELGCNNYVIKPVDYEEFVNAIKQLGLFLKIVQVPKLD